MCGTAVPIHYEVINMTLFLLFISVVSVLDTFMCYTLLINAKQCDTSIIEKKKQFIYN